MAPSCWKDFIYVACCCLGDEYLHEIDEYNKQREREAERLCPKEPTIHHDASILKKTQSCAHPIPV